MHEPGQHSRERRHRCHFEIVDVTTLFDYYFLTGLRVQLDRGLIAHRSGGHKQRRLFFKDLRSKILQAINGWIFAVNVIADFGFSHRAAHCRRGFGYSVAPQIDHWFSVLVVYVMRRRKQIGALKFSRDSIT